MQFDDPYARTALIVYLVVLAAMTFGFAGLRLLARGRAWSRTRKPLSQASRLGGGAVATIAPWRSGRFLVYGRGAKAELVGGKEEMHDLVPVERVALVKDMDSQTGLVLRMRGEDVCVSGLGEMARLTAQLVRDEVPVAFVFRRDEGERMKSLFEGLDANKRALVGKWLVENEILTDIVDGVEYEGSIEGRRQVGKATMIVTNFRVGLLATTYETRVHGRGQQVITHWNMLTYLLPVAEKVVLERKRSLRKDQYLLKLELPKDKRVPDVPTLRLTKDNTGVLLPILVFRRPLEFVDPGASPVAFLGGLAAMSWKPMIPFGLVGAALAVMLREQQGSYYERYFLAIVLGALATPIILSSARLLETWMERMRLRQGVPAG